MYQGTLIKVKYKNALACHYRLSFSSEYLYNSQKSKRMFRFSNVTSLYLMFGLISPSRVRMRNVYAYTGIRAYLREGID